MEEIIKKLSAIESSASAILAEAGDQKKVLADKYTKLTSEWDETLEADTEAQLAKLRENMQADIDSKIKTQKENADKELAHMQQQYDSDHERYVAKLFNDMTEA